MQNRQMLALAVLMLCSLSPGCRPGRGAAESVPAANTPAANAYATPAPLAGNWAGVVGTTTLRLTLAQAGDSVRGTGTYISHGSATGCGGETLPDSGRVMLDGSTTASGIAAHLRFDNGWGPPFLATRAGADSLVGHLMAVDRAPCPLTLVRERGSA